MGDLLSAEAVAQRFRGRHADVEVLGCSRRAMQLSADAADDQELNPALEERRQ